MCILFIFLFRLSSPFSYYEYDILICLLSTSALSNFPPCVYIIFFVRIKTHIHTRSRTEPIFKHEFHSKNNSSSFTSSHILAAYFISLYVRVCMYTCIPHGSHTVDWFKINLIYFIIINWWCLLTVALPCLYVWMSFQFPRLNAKLIYAPHTKCMYLWTFIIITRARGGEIILFCSIFLTCTFYDLTSFFRGFFRRANKTRRKKL